MRTSNSTSSTQPSTRGGVESVTTQCVAIQSSMARARTSIRTLTRSHGIRRSQEVQRAEAHKKGGTRRHKHSESKRTRLLEGQGEPAKGRKTGQDRYNKFRGQEDKRHMRTEISREQSALGGGGKGQATQERKRGKTHSAQGQFSPGLAVTVRE